MKISIPGSCSAIFRYKKIEHDKNGYAGVGLPWESTHTLYGLAITDTELKIIRQHGGQQQTIASIPMALMLNTRYWVRFEVEPLMFHPDVLHVRARIWQDQSDDTNEDSAWNAGEPETWNVEVYE